MLKLKKILLPVDYSPRGVTATECVRVLAKCCEPHVTVLHVASESAHRATGEISDAPTLRMAFEATLRERLAGIETVFTEFTGDPAHVIVEFSREHGTDLIIMPTRGHGALRRFLLGSVTAKVLNDADCPVWTGVHTDDEQTRQKCAGIGHVACGVDLGPQSERVLRWASDFAAAFDARLTVIHASTQLEPVIGVVHDLEFRAQISKAIHEQVSELIERTGIKSESKVAPGEPSKAVTTAAEEIGADVLVIGRTPDGLLGRLRTNAYGIIRQSSCPVVSV
jgi:nucleotide-binding universal stress UspA family protein